MNKASPSPLATDDMHLANERAVQASVEAIVTVDAQQRIAMLNPAALRMFGCEADDVLGQPLSIFIPARYRDAHAERVMQFQRSGEVERPMGLRGCLVGLRADGTEFPIAATITRVLASGRDRSHGFSTAVLRDLSKEQALEHDLDSLRDHFQRLFDVAPIAIWVTERDRIVFFNKSCQDLLGSGPILGRSLYDLLHPASHEAVRHQLARALEGGPGVHRLQERLLRPDGGLREVEIAIAALPGPNRSTVQMVLSDITRREQERKLLQSSRQELRRLSASMVDAREDERKRIARELHDELGQRLSALKMDLADGANGLNSTHDELRRDRMLEMLDDTVAAVRRIAADLRPLMLDDLGLNAAVEWLARESARRLGIEVTVRLDEHEPPIDHRATTALYRMVQEALTNVARHARATDVRIELRVQGQELVLTVQDNGRGFPPGATRKEGSFGLMGMRERAYLLGGELLVDNPPGGGGRITVRLPLPAAGDPPTPLETP